MAGKCFETYGREWSEDQNRRTVEFFEGYSKQNHVLWEIEVRHITGKPECIAVAGNHMKAWVEQALTNYIYNSENRPGELERFWINHDVEESSHIYLFTYSSFFPFFGVKDPVFYKAYRTVEEFIDDGWTVV